MKTENPPQKPAKAIISMILVLLIILVGLGVMKFLQANGPKASKQLSKKEVPVIRTLTVSSEPTQLFVKTQGSVKPSRKTQAASEVMGRVIDVSSAFKVGESFTKGDILLEIDGADYVSNLATAEATLADARLVLTQEEARADQANRDWKRLGRGEPSELVLRIPQIKSAKARILAAEASVGKAKRDLERTKLRAPYDCRVEATYTDLGSYITPGVPLADLYSIDAFEVRVPVTLDELGYLESSDVGGAEVDLSARIGNENLEWKGKVARSEKQIDRKTMTLYVVVEIIANDSSYPFPPSGLFVDAKIKGKSLEDVIKIPRSALRDNDTVLILSSESRLKFHPVEVVRSMSDTVIISNSLKNGTKVIISPMETAVKGMELQEEGAE